MLYVLLNIFNSIFANGFCKAPDEDDEEGEGEEETEVRVCYEVMGTSVLRTYTPLQSLIPRLTSRASKELAVTFDEVVVAKVLSRSKSVRKLPQTRVAQSCARERRVHFRGGARRQS